ncbi:MAG: leucine-rich repeat protein [Oscillospiraceae bacterium]|jgi:uncharacterized repeat protein (TIGR02543 family)|nr:leucine-rich repeat protein [Oscillospiraceae bacterium]
MNIKTAYRKITAALLALAMAFAIVPAAIATYPGDFTYTITDGKATVTGYTGTDTDIEIPATLGGAPVTEIGDSAFEQYNALESIIIPDGVTSIGASAFEVCTSLKSIIIPDSVSSIGTRAFEWSSSLTSIKIPSSLTAISSRLFNFCSSLESVIIPEGVKTIGVGSFANCSSLKSVVIPDGLTSIDEIAFINCSPLESIKIPNSVTSIGMDAFSYCQVLTIYVEAAAPYAGWNDRWNYISRPVVYSAKFVTFADYDGTILKQQGVANGGAATAPDVPPREGYNFTGWDTEFDNVTSHLMVTALYEQITYTVKFVDYDGTILKQQTVIHSGAATAPDVPPREGYNFTGWDAGFDNVTSHLTVTAQYEQNTFTVTFVDYDGATLKQQSVLPGGAATAPDVPTRAGYTFTGWDKSFDSVTENLTVTAQYAATPPPAWPFVDVTTADWFYNAVSYAYYNKLYAGIDDTHFNPHGTMTRGMLVTVMYQFAGKPQTTAANPFSDVPEEAWYAKAVVWAADNKVVSGIGGGQFAPDKNITREEVAAILYRFAKDYEKLDMSKTKALSFADNEQISDFAKIPVSWCVANGIITGKNGNMFDPQGNATRAEVATMVHKFAGVS